MKNRAITSRDVDFGKWYTDVVKSAHLATYSKVKGCIVYEPNGYAIWEKIQEVLNKKFKETNHKNVYMPLLIPENLLKKEGDLIKGFAPEVAWVTSGGNKELEERMCIRPTSETLFSEYYSEVVETYRDLPLLYNQWCNVLRWEKETRPFLRGREFMWQEGHTVHETKDEAEAETKRMLNVYKSFFEEYLAIPVITGLKTEKEKFAGAEYTMTVEALMYNGMSLQSATSHYFGQKFSKAYDITFTNRNNELENVYQTSWGLSTRAIGALIMVHSDDLGLVLPPYIAPMQVVIIPISNADSVTKITNDIYNKINASNISVSIDNSDKSAGYKFAESEVNGIPIRIEVGERDLKEDKITIVRRDTLSKYKVDADIDIVDYINNLIDTIQKDMFNKALEHNKNRTYEAHSLEDVKSIMNTKPGFIKAMWCGCEECELKMKEINGTKSRCIVEGAIDDKCVVCGKDASKAVIWGIQY